MRISDWSSDVCSSDLLDWAENLEGLRRRNNGEMMVGSYGGSYGGMYQVLLYAVDPKHRLRVLAPDITQIGRASCRERVCQYVSISVVAVSLKKKNHYLIFHISLSFILLQLSS